MSHLSAFLEKVEARSARVGVVGLGYVGLPLAVRAAQAGFRVLGIELNPERVRQVNAGESYIDDVPAGTLKELVRAGRLEATVDYGRARELDVVSICVPTPLDRHRQPDLSYVVGAARALAPHLRPGVLVSLESTTFPGTTEEVVRPLLEEGSGLRAGRDFFLAYSPERIDPGSQTFTVENTPRVVGGLNPESLEAALAYYRTLVRQVHPVSSPRAAEMTKLLENIFRVVNVALVNEMALLADRLGIDIWEVIEAAATKPFGFMPFYPGPGVGGHCIPVDPLYLTWKAREVDFQTHFIELATEINLQMPYFVREKVIRVLNRAGKALRGSRVLLLGVAYKRDIGDVRESPALKLIDLLEAYGAQVLYHDPHVPRLRLEDGRVLESQPLTVELLAGCDVAVIVTDHRDVDYGLVLEHAPAVVDTRNATRRLVKGNPGGRVEWL